MFGPRLYRSFCMFLLLCVYVGFTVAGKKYKLKLISLEKCKLPASVMFKDAPLEYTFSARKVDRNTALINSFFIVKAKEGPVFFSVRGYQITQSSSKDLIFHVEKVSCTNPITTPLINVINLKLDKNCCSIPGNYTAENINIQDFASLFTKAMIGIGKYSYDIEFSTSKGVAACISISCDITEK